MKKILLKTPLIFLGIFFVILSVGVLPGDASALSADQLKSQYKMSGADAQKLLREAKKDVRQQCGNRPPAGFDKCVDNKTQPVIKKHADTCVRSNGNYDFTCSTNLSDRSADPERSSVDSAAGVDSACGPDGCDLIQKYLNPAINLLSVLFGFIAVASLIAGGIQYSMSEGDPQKAAKAKDRMAQTIIAVFAYAFIFSFLQFIIPGGVFNR